MGSGDRWDSVGLRTSVSVDRLESPYYRGYKRHGRWSVVSVPTTAQITDRDSKMIGEAESVARPIATAAVGVNLERELDQEQDIDKKEEEKRSNKPPEQASERAKRKRIWSKVGRHLREVVSGAGEAYAGAYDRL